MRSDPGRIISHAVLAASFLLLLSTVATAQADQRYICEGTRVVQPLAFGKLVPLDDRGPIELPVYDYPIEIRPDGSALVGKVKGLWTISAEDEGRYTFERGVNYGFLDTNKGAATVIDKRIGKHTLRCKRQ